MINVHNVTKARWCLALSLTDKCCLTRAGPLRRFAGVPEVSGSVPLKNRLGRLVDNVKLTVAVWSATCT